MATVGLCATFLSAIASAIYDGKLTFTRTVAPSSTPAVEEVVETAVNYHIPYVFYDRVEVPTYGPPPACDSPPTGRTGCHPWHVAGMTALLLCFLFTLFLLWQRWSAPPTVAVPAAAPDDDGTDNSGSRPVQAGDLEKNPKNLAGGEDSRRSSYATAGTSVPGEAGSEQDTQPGVSVGTQTDAAPGVSVGTQTDAEQTPLQPPRGQGSPDPYELDALRRRVRDLEGNLVAFQVARECAEQESNSARDEANSALQALQYVQRRRQEREDFWEGYFQDQVGLRITRNARLQEENAELRKQLDELREQSHLNAPSSNQEAPQEQGQNGQQGTTNDSQDTQAEPGVDDSAHQNTDQNPDSDHEARTDEHKSTDADDAASKPAGVPHIDEATAKAPPAPPPQGTTTFESGGAPEADLDVKGSPKPSKNLDQESRGEDVEDAEDQNQDEESDSNQKEQQNEQQVGKQQDDQQQDDEGSSSNEAGEKQQDDGGSSSSEAKDQHQDEGLSSNDDEDDDDDEDSDENGDKGSDDHSDEDPGNDGDGGAGAISSISSSLPSEQSNDSPQANPDPATSENDQQQDDRHPTSNEDGEKQQKNELLPSNAVVVVNSDEDHGTGGDGGASAIPLASASPPSEQNSTSHGSNPGQPPFLGVPQLEMTPVGADHTASSCRE